VMGLGGLGLGLIGLGLVLSRRRKVRELAQGAHAGSD
jgi:hypothetical protein